MGFRYDLEPVKKDEAKEKSVMQEDKSWLEDEYEWPDEIFDNQTVLGRNQGTNRALESFAVYILI